jgi:hypothetical protein
MRGLLFLDIVNTMKDDTELHLHIVSGKRSSCLLHDVGGEAVEDGTGATEVSGIVGAPATLRRTPLGGRARNQGRGPAANTSYRLL